MPTSPRTLALAALLTAAPAFAAQSTIDQLRDACGDEVRDLCAHIAPGNGRLVACLYANEDMVAPRCNYVLYQSAPELGAMIASLTKMANDCRPDIERLCTEFQPGQGGIAKCLQLHRTELAPACTDAIAAAGVETK